MGINPVVSLFLSLIDQQPILMNEHRLRSLSCFLCAPPFTNVPLTRDGYLRDGTRCDQGKPGRNLGTQNIRVKVAGVLR